MPDQINDSLPDTAELTKGEQTRSEILKAALPLFSKQGYHGTSMRQIAENAGIALGGIYNHFGGKEDIFNAVLFAYHPIHTVLPSLEASQGETVEEMVHFSAHQMHEAFADGREFINLLFIEAVEFKGRHFPKLFAELFPRALNFSKELRKKRGRLREDIPLPVMVITFIGLTIVSFFFFRVFGAKDEFGKPETVLHQVVDIYLHGILSPQAAPRTDS